MGRMKELAIDLENGSPEAQAIADALNAEWEAQEQERDLIELDLESDSGWYATQDADNQWIHHQMEDALEIEAEMVGTRYDRV